MQHFENFKDERLKAAIIEALNGKDTRPNVFFYDRRLFIKYGNLRKLYYCVTLNSDRNVVEVRDNGRINYDYDIFGYTHDIDCLLADCGLTLTDEWIKKPSDC